MNDLDDDDIIPRPAASPRPRTERRLDPQLEEPKTDPGIPVYPEYVKVKLAQAAAIINSQHEEQMRKHDNKLTVRSVIVAIGAVCTGVAAVLIFFDNRVHAQTDAGVQVMTEKHEALKARVETLEKRFDRFEDRTDKQMNALLDAAHVPESKRPPPLKDAGE